jgi:hypothetical protein
VNASAPPRLEQLLFTWSESGLDGRAGFQRIAASAGFTDRGSPLTAAAIRLCRYDRPKRVVDPADAPVSYGWLDRDGIRLVFCRTYVGLDAWGRPGNFCAHIVAGPIDTLPVAHLARRFGSPFWWAGGPVERGVLPLVTLAEITEMPPEPPGEALPEVVDRLLTDYGRRPVTVAAPPQAVVGLASWLATALPGVFGGCAVSTYESVEPVGAFDLVGTLPGVAYPGSAVVTWLPAGHPVGRCAALIVSDDRPDRELVGLALDAARAGDGTVPVNRLVSVLDVYARLTSGEPAVLPELLPLLADRTSAGPTLALATPAGAMPVLDTVTEGLLDGNLALATALDRSSGTQTRVALGRLARRLGARVAAVGRPGLIPTVLRLAEVIGSDVADEFIADLLRRAVADPELLATVDPATCVRLLESCSDEHTDVVEQLLIGAMVTYATVASANLPVEWRADVVAGALRHGHGTTAEVARLLTIDAELARHVALRMPDEGTLTRLSDAVDDRRAATLAPDLATALGPEPAAHLLGRVAARLPGNERLHFVRRHAPGPGVPLPTWWRPIVRAAVEAAVRDALISLAWPVGVVFHETTRGLVTRVGGPFAAAWAQVLRLCGTRGDDVSAMQQCVRRGGVLDVEDRELVFDLVLTACINTGMRWSDVYAVVLEMQRTSGGHVGTTVNRILRVGRCAAQRPGGYEAAAVCLPLLATLVHDDRVPTSRLTGHLADTTAQRHAAELARMLWHHGADWTAVDGEIGRLNGRARRWWRTLPAASRRERSGPAGRVRPARRQV